MCCLYHWYVQEAEKTAQEEEIGFGLKERRGAEQKPAVS